MQLEIVVDDAEGLALAAAGGADRIELCAALALGALTPSAGLMRLAADCGVPVHAMIRPRAGDFRFSPADLAIALDDIRAARAAGLAGVVIGVSAPDGRLDAVALARQTDAAGPMEVTLHRCFDVTPDAAQALETAVALGVTRIMTAGHAPCAVDGAGELAALVRQSAGRVQVMAGGGVVPAHVPALASCGVDAVHASCSVPRPVTGPLGSLRIAPERPRADAALIAALRKAVNAAAAAGAFLARQTD
ncbi:copper homeostasis protein CutC [Paracoccus luteus]|uniref:copper homeostasis protein CutC n=1 Tax=Paracoccus luteus TaxID=2508543 RepID=UPI0010701516|nr:copper homeostasis protein CutC [Paracoccus luteus]